MQSPDDPPVEACVEVLCGKGCRQVRLAILALEAGADLPEVRDLTPRQRDRLLAELKAIMAVYGDACRLD
ncbi:hypothetical protein [Thiocystis violacea]|uniref:hypothetical protein n=1 Tax=Thiocystis violacea TaxID=13725 RepID=UPI001903DE85|nr:hypothetical protein [Thiocystis violacea]MBK1720653.1 hypothetical protein [Thiocystis violacea]